MPGISSASARALFASLLLFFSLQLGANVETDQIQGLIAEGKLRQALTLTDRQLQENESSVTFRFLKGLILTRLNELDQARELFTGLTRDHPELPEPYNNLAVIYASQGDFEKARGALQQAISTHPSYATAHENMGDIYAKMASRAYNQALQLDSDNSSAKAKLSLVNDLFFVPRPEADVVNTLASIERTPETAQADVMEKAKAENALAASTEVVAEAQPEASAEPVIDQQKIELERQQAAQAAEEKQRREEKTLADIRQTIEGWAAAWSAKNPSAYISYYGPDFTPPKKMPRPAWENQRKVRLEKPKFIKVTISRLAISMLGEDHARATFRQAYQSDTYQDEVSKTLILKKSGELWRITQEQSG